MRSRAGTGGLSYLVLIGAVGSVRAQPAEPAVTASAARAVVEAPRPAVGYGAMPGGMTVPDAVTLPQGTLELITLDGYGYRKGALGTAHTMTRALGSIAVAFGIHPLLTIGLSLEGRHDSHENTVTGSDDGYVGDPHVLARFATAAGAARFGAQLGIWVPGKDAPSIAGSAISVDLRALASLPAGPGILSFSSATGSTTARAASITPSC